MGCVARAFGTTTRGTSGTRSSSHLRATMRLAHAVGAVDEHEGVAPRECLGERRARGLVRGGREIRGRIDRRAERLAIQTEVRPLHAGLLVRDAEPRSGTSC